MPQTFEENTERSKIIKKLLAKWIANEETRQKARLLLINKKQLKSSMAPKPKSAIA